MSEQRSETSYLATRWDFYALWACFVFLVCWFRHYLSDQNIASVDLPGHIAAIERLGMHWWRGNFSFYDPHWMSGWPAFQFYGFFGHLLAAILSYPLRLFSDEPVRFAVHLLFVFGSAALPFSVYYASLPFAKEIADRSFDRIRWLLAISVCTFTFWFLNHDQQWHGIGAAGISNIGLFGQLFGWHFALLHFGALSRFIRVPSPRNSGWLTLFFFLTLISHLLTAVFSASLVLLSFLWFRERRVGLILSHALSFLLAGFWFLPILLYSGSYTVLDIFRPRGDFLELFLRYPWYALARNFGSWVEGEFQILNPTNIIALVFLVGILVHGAVRRSRLLIVFTVFLMIVLIAISSGFVASSLPVGFHYYRFHAYLFLFLCVVVSVVPIAFLVEVEGSVGEKILAIGMAAVLLASFGFTARLPHYEWKQIHAHTGQHYLSDEQAVLDYFREQPQKGRVLFEYFSDYQRFPFLSAHYMVSRLQKETGFESINGLFIQSSLAIRFPIFSAYRLGAKLYRAPILFDRNSDLSDETKVQQLREFGVTHVVLSQTKLLKRLESFAVAAPVQFGPYHIVSLVEQAPSPAQYVRKEVLGYYDEKGNMPFRFLQFYFHSREQLTSRFELLELERGQKLPPQMTTLLVNGEVEESELLQIFSTDSLPVVENLNFSDSYLTDHYKVQYQHNIELDQYWAVESYLAEDRKLDSRLSQASVFSSKSDESDLPFRWGNRFQEFALSRLQSDRLVRINYSYFPFWKSSDGEVYRGSGERIFFLPNREQAVLSYSPFSSKSGWIGYLCSLIAMTILVRQFRRAG